jgi:hypothetical protein
VYLVLLVRLLAEWRVLPLDLFLPLPLFQLVRLLL